MTIERRRYAKTQSNDGEPSSESARWQSLQPKLPRLSSTGTSVGPIVHEILRSARGLGAGSETLPFQPTHSCWLTRFPRCAAKNPALTVAEYSIVRGKARRRMGHLPWAQVCFSRSGTACGQAINKFPPENVHMLCYQQRFEIAATLPS